MSEKMVSNDLGQLDENITLKKREKFSFGLAVGGSGVAYALISSYLMLYLTDIFGIAAAAVGTLFLVARIWDAVNDPVMGIIADNTRTKWGRFRPYLLFMPIILGIVTMLLFWGPNLSGSGKIIYAYILYILWGMSYTALDVPAWALMPTLTKNIGERNKLVSFANGSALLTSLLVAVVTLPLVGALGGENPALGFRYTAIIFAVLVVVFPIIGFFNTKERVVVKGNRLKLKDMGEILATNRPLQLVVLAMFITLILGNVRTGLAIYYMIYNLGVPQLIPVIMFTTLGAMVLGNFIAPVILKKVEKKISLIGGFILSALAMLTLFLVGYSSLPIFFITLVAVGIASGVITISGVAMVADSVEYGEWKTGKRAEGVTFSIRTFTTKLGLIGGAVAGYVLAMIGYVPNVAQPVEVLDNLHRIYTLLPAAASLLSIIPLLFYKLSNKRLAEIMKEIKERKEAKA